MEATVSKGGEKKEKRTGELQVFDRQRGHKTASPPPLPHGLIVISTLPHVRQQN